MGKKALPADMQKARRRRRLALNLLGIEDATQADPLTLRRQFRSRAKALHPDHRADKAEAESDFQLLQNAFDFLMYGDRGQELEQNLTGDEERDVYGYLRNDAGYRYNIARKFGGGLWATEDPDSYEPPQRTSCI